MVTAASCYRHPACQCNTLFRQICNTRCYAKCSNVTCCYASQMRARRVPSVVILYDGGMHTATAATSQLELDPAGSCMFPTSAQKRNRVAELVAVKDSWFPRLLLIAVLVCLHVGWINLGYSSKSSRMLNIVYLRSPAKVNCLKWQKCSQNKWLNVTRGVFRTFVR